MIRTILNNLCVKCFHIRNRSNVGDLSVPALDDYQDRSPDYPFRRTLPIFRIGIPARSVIESPIRPLCTG